LHLRVVSYSRPLFYIWLGTMAQHIIWWQSTFVVLDRPHSLAGWGQSAFILLCTSVSFLAPIAKSPRRRNYFKWLMMMAAFLLPPWRDPWYVEPILILQVRWIIMAILFIVQCFESYALANVEKRHLADLYLLRIGWVPVVHPILLLYAIASVLYYGFTMIKIRIEASLPRCDPTPLQQPPTRNVGQTPLSIYHAEVGIANILEAPKQQEGFQLAPYQEAWREFSAYTSRTQTY
jgi:hypothetical protein